MVLRKNKVLSILFFIICTTFCAQTSPEDYIKVIESTVDDDLKYKALDSLIFALKWDENPKQYANYTEVYIDLAIERNNFKDAIHAATFAFSAINNQLGEPARALKMLNKVEAYKDQVDDTEIVGTIYLKKGGAYYNGKDFSKAVVNYTKATEIFTAQDSIFEADAIFFRGQAQFAMGNYVDAVNDFDVAYQFYENLGDEQYMFYTKANIISAYGINGFHSKTIEERNKLIDKKLSINYYDGLAVDYYNQSINYGRVNDLEAQEACLLKALKYLDSNKNHHNPEGEFVMVHSALASFYMKTEDLDKAKTYLDKAETKAMAFSEMTFFKLAFVEAKAKYLFLTGDLEASEQLALRALKQTETWKRTSLIIYLNTLLYEINTAKGSYKDALKYFEAKTKIQDSIFSKEKTNAFSYYQTLYETERKEKEIATQDANIKILEQEKSIEQGKTRTLIILLAFLIAVTVGVVYVFKQRARQLKETLVFHKKELTAYTKELVKKSREHDILKDELMALKKEQLDDNKLEKLQDLISSKILTTEDWKEFKLKFEKVYPSFLIKARLNNELTNADERLLTLEKLNLKTSEIADVLGVSSDSVIKNRYRLRKKLGLSKNTPITEIAKA
ncbi:MAG: hypothetical protein AAFX55_18340 [Bacteroidota bacterium]